MNDLRKELFAACLGADVSILGFDKCCQLMAWTLVFGGYTSETVLNIKLREAIFYAQRRLRIKGGEVPDVDGVLRIQEYTRDLRAYAGGAAKPVWLAEMEADYGVESKPDDGHKKKAKAKKGTRNL
jgi:hypothetical protein